MFKIYCGKQELWQWDLNQKLIVEDATVNQVHFCNKTDDCSLVVEVYELDGVRVADVPNVLLQTAWTIRAYAYDTNHTLIEQRFKVNARSKPADYVYTETEILNWESFTNEINGEIIEINSLVNDTYVLADEARTVAYDANNIGYEALDTANNAYEIAKGANQAIVFDTYNDFCDWVLKNGVSIGIHYPVGNVILIKQLNVPDLYFYSACDTYITDIPTDNEILTNLSAQGYFDIGYCRVAQMETQKVDLSDYAKKAQVPTITTTLKDNGAYTLTITKGVE